MKDLEVKVGQNGPYAHFTIASDNGKHENAGVSFIRISALGDWLNDLTDLRKGSFLTIKSVLKTTEHDGKTVLECVAKEISRPALKEVPV